MTWQPTLSWQNAQKRAKILQQIRLFFSERNVLEVESPALSQGTVTDLHLDAFSCPYNFLKAPNGVSLYLQTSPEFHMKRLLASGYGCIYQIAKAFRHEEFGKYHNPEFTLLEWYRLGFDQFDLMAEVEALLVTILMCEKAEQISYQQVFMQIVNIDPLSATRDQLLALIKQHQKLSDWLVEDSINDADNDLLLQFVFSEIIEPSIGLTQPCFVYNFPKSQASLAQICPDDPRVAQRFECYFKGIELVNGFCELTDVQQQLLRFEQDNTKREKLAKMPKPIDQHFIQALSHGLPKCSGVALGIDRLIMLAINETDIKKVITFPISNA